MPKERRDTDKKDRKHAKKSSSSRKSSHKKDSRDRDRDRDRERSAKHRHKHKSSHHRGESGASLPGDAGPISEDDYFLRATEFRVWLAQTKGKFVDDLSTEETTALFRDEFARKWNRGKLARMFYEGLPDAVLEQTKRTRHRWGFVDKLGERERFDLATAKDSVDVATRKEDLLNVHAGSNSRARGPMPAAQDEAKRKRKASDDAGEEEEKDEAWRRRKSERKRQREDRDSVLDELAPKATGREAQLEKRRQVGQKLHGAARDREDARDGLDLSEEFIMGGGRGGAKDDDFQRRLAQRDSTRRRKEEERREKLAGLAAKESARMDKFLADMGLAGANGGKPMTIAPRR